MGPIINCICYKAIAYSVLSKKRVGNLADLIRYTMIWAPKFIQPANNLICYDLTCLWGVA